MMIKSGRLSLKSSYGLIAERKNFSAFDTLDQIINGQDAKTKEEIQRNMLLRLINLKSEFNRYFPDCEDKSITVIKVVPCARAPRTVVLCLLIKYC